jgi:hypothetical protein
MAVFKGGKWEERGVLDERRARHAAGVAEVDDQRKVAAKDLLVSASPSRVVCRCCVDSCRPEC